MPSTLRINTRMRARENFGWTKWEIHTEIIDGKRFESIIEPIVEINPKSNLAKSDDVRGWANFISAETLHWLLGIKGWCGYRYDGLDTTGLHTYDNVEDAINSPAGLSEAQLNRKIPIV